MTCFIKQFPSTHKASKVLFILERILGPQDDEELHLIIVHVLSALDKESRTAGVSYLEKVFDAMDPDTSTLINDLLDAAVECREELAELLDQDVLTLNQGPATQQLRDAHLSTILCNEVRQYFSAFLTADTLPNKKFSLPAPIPEELDNVGTSVVPLLAKPAISTYANRTEYSLVWEAKHTNESITITSVLDHLQIDPAFAQVYAPVTTFNSVQLQVVDPIFHGGNTLVAAPTGAGKTNIALWAMICLLHISQCQHLPVQLAIYVAPLKALVREVLSRLESSLQQLPNSYNAILCEYTGEESISLSAISSLLHGLHTSTTLIVLVATPEKLDVFTSKLIGEDFQLIRARLVLVVLDELHLIGDHTRGSVIEELVLRFHRHYQNTMLLALSATIPNTQQLAEFLHCAPSNTLVFDSSYRAVSLHVTVCEMYYKYSEESHLRTTRETFLHSILPKQLSKGGLLLFTHTRRDAERLALQLQAKLCSAEYSKTYADRSRNKKLYSLLSGNSAVLFHHAGLCRADRHLVEELFTEKKISVLVSTATLAWGVNMPAHTVVILGTRVYTNSQWEALSFADILQMAGRAGRPSFDTYGECFIIPSPNDTHRCLNIFENRFHIESSFLSSHAAIEKLSKLIITEAFLSAHVFTNEITHIIMSSLFAAQLLARLPTSIDGSQFIAELTATLLDCCCSVGLLDTRPDETDPCLLQYHPTFLAQLCIRYYVSPFTVVRFNAILLQTPIDTLQQALLLIATSHEYSPIFIRADERFELTSLEEHAPIKYPPFTTRHELGKICLLLQVYISTGPCYGTISAAFGSLSLMSDYASIVASAPRVVGCLRELAYFLKQGQSHQHLNRLYCMLQSRCWPAVLFVREVLGNPLFKSDLLSVHHMKWIEQLELKQFNSNTLQKLTLDQLSQIVFPPSAEDPPDKREVSRLLTAIIGYPTLRSRLVHLCQLELEHYELRFQCCLVGDQAILRCSEQTFTLHCVIEAEEKTLKTLSLSMYLNEELDIVLRFRATDEIWVCHMHIYLEELLFPVSSMRFDLVGACPNKNLLASASITKHTSDEATAITSYIQTTIATLGTAPGSTLRPNPILIAGNCLYMQQAEMLNDMLTLIRSTSVNYKIDLLATGSTNGFSKQIAQNNDLPYMNAYTVYKQLGKLFTRPTVIVIPSIADLASPAGYVLELLLMRIMKKDPSLPILLISFSINLIEPSLVALSLFLDSKSFVISSPDSLLVVQDVPPHVHAISASLLCDDPDQLHNVYEALYLVDDDPELSLLTPFFLCQLLMMCKASGTVYIIVHECILSTTGGMYLQYLNSQLPTADGLFMLISEQSRDLYAKGFDYVAEHIITADISQSYLYFSFSVLPGQYVNHRTMVNYHPKPGKEDYLREEDAMLDSLSNWLSEELIAIEHSVTTLLRAWQQNDYIHPGYICLSMIAAELYTTLDTNREQAAKSLWFLALSRSVHNFNLLMLCASSIYDNELADYIHYEKALLLSTGLEVDRAVLETLADLVESCAESRVYALLVALTSLVIRVNEHRDRSVFSNISSEKLKVLLSNESFAKLCMDGVRQTNIE